MSNKISRRAFLKCAGVSAAAVGSASLLSGCKTNGSNTTVNDVKVGDTVKNWNGLGVQLSSVFHLTQDPAQPGYEYLGVRVTVLNRSKTDSYTIGAQGVDAINAAYPVPPLENVDANFQAMAAATTDFVATCDGQGAAGCEQRLDLRQCVSALSGCEVAEEIGRQDAVVGAGAAAPPPITTAPRVGRSCSSTSTSIS